VCTLGPGSPLGSAVALPAGVSPDSGCMSMSMSMSLSLSICLAWAVGLSALLKLSDPWAAGQRQLGMQCFCGCFVSGQRPMGHSVSAVLTNQPPKPGIKQCCGLPQDGYPVQWFTCSHVVSLPVLAAQARNSFAHKGTWLHGKASGETSTVLETVKRELYRTSPLLDANKSKGKFADHHHCWTL
jgi:hypothetical protein